MKIIKSLLLSVLMLSQHQLTAESLDQVLNSSQKKVAAAASSQQKIDGLSEQSQELFEQYKQTEKLVEDLKMYNQKLSIQVDNQAQRLSEIDTAIAQVQIMQRQILPLMDDMVTQLEQFIALDLPFHQEERTERIGFLRASMNRSDLSTAEKFRQLLEAWNIENEYGRKIEVYPASVTVDGAERKVDMLRIGRIALIYQSLDGATAGAWNSSLGEWQSLEAGDYQAAVKQAIKIANKQANIDVMTLPVATAEAF